MESNQRTLQALRYTLPYLQAVVKMMITMLTVIIIQQQWLFSICHVLPMMSLNFQSIPCPYNRPADEMPTVTAFNPRNHQGSPASPAQHPIRAQVAQSSPWKTGVHYTEWIRRLPPHPFSFAVVLNLLWGQFNPQRQWENKTVSCGWYHRWYPT